jgi:Leucine-rich repeat (LRR) protein
LISLSRSGSNEVAAMAAGTAGALISGLITVLQRRPGLMPKMEREQENLLNLLLEIQPVMVDAELRAEWNDEVRNWLSDLKAAAYDADDILDEFSYAKLQAEAETSRHQNVKKECTTLSSLYKISNIKILFNWGVRGELQGLAKRIGQVKERIGLLVERMREFDFEEGNGISQVHAERLQQLTSSSQIEISVRNKEKEEIVQLLLNSSNTHDHKDYGQGIGIPIIGEEGVGKTILARCVCSDPQINNHFDCILWVEVGHELSPAKITKTIIDQTIGRDSGISENDTDLLQRRIYQQLSGRRYLLVLDDVRTDKEIRLGEFKSWLEQDAGNGSSLLVTTRFHDLKQIFGSKSPHKYEIPALMPDILWGLFHERASIADKDICAEMHEMGEKIILGCKGSLLLVNLMGGLMRFKKELAEWQEVVNQLKNLRDGDTFSIILRLCYDNLTLEMKQCFAFCSIFPVGHYMDQEVLIKLWIANGFISSDGSTNPEEKGDMIFNELVLRYFFEEVKLIHKDAYRKKHEYESRVVCKMSNLLHSLAKSVSGSEYSTQHIEEFKHLSAQAPEIRHLSITGHDSSLDVNVMSKSYPSLRTLIYPEDPFLRTVENCNMLPGSNTLRVLDLRSALFYQDLFELKYMIHLRYLDLSSSRIKRLPESTCSLYNLQTLDLSKCWFLRRLPEDMRYMRNLRHLYIHKCPKLTKMPLYLRELCCLQTLTTYIVGEHMGNSIDQLKSMNDLGGLVELYDLRKVKDGSTAKEADLVSKTKLESLTLCWGRQQLVMPKETYDFSNESDLGVWENLKPHNQLKVLKIQLYGCLDVATWLDSPVDFLCLVELHLIGCSQWQTLPAVCSTPSLQVLCLKHMVSLTYFFMDESGLSPFPNLKRLVLADLKRLERWNQKEETEESTSTVPILTFPKLDEVEITNCPKLVSIPNVPRLKHLTVCIENHMLLQSVMDLIKAESLVQANIGDAISEDMPFSLQTELEGPNNHNLRMMRLDSANIFFKQRKIFCFWKLLGSLENLEIFNCDNLSTLPLDEFRNLNRLKRLSIQKCPNLTLLFPGEMQEFDGLFPQLETLEFYGCPSLEKVPKFPSILSLELDECPNIRRIPKLIDLQMLYLSCRSWTDLPGGIGRLSCLRSLRLSKCYSLTSLPGEFCQLAGRYFFLHILIIIECPKLIDLPPNFDGMLSGLKELHISKCPGLEKFCKEGSYSSIISQIGNKRNDSAGPSCTA